jgi:DNA replication protein DnaC
MSKIDETLKKIAADTQSGNPDKTPQTWEKPAHDLPGEPDCPHCQGVGYLRVDLPVGHPDFGKVETCVCRRAQINLQVRQKLFSMSNLEKLSHLTFENFNPRGHVGLRPLEADSLERAYNQSQQFAQKLEGWLLLQGDFGCGKTHLAAAIANFAVSLGVPTLFITVPDLLDTLRFSYDNPQATYEERFDEIRQSKLLILDDFGTENATSWAQEKLFQIINYRYINRLPLVVTTNLGLGQIEARIRSRLQDPELITRVRIISPDFRNPTDDSGHSKLSSLSLHRNKTFATFDMRTDEGLSKEDIQSLEKAFRSARAFAENPKGWLVITGTYGSGKTHLAAAIANFRADMGYSQLFKVVPDLFDHLRATFSPNSSISLDRQFEEIRTHPLLILDDFGTQSMTPWVREKLYQLFNYRYVTELPTVITTADHRDHMDKRILSRMEDSRLSVIYAITAPSYRGLPPKSKKAGSRKKAK